MASGQVSVGDAMSSVESELALRPYIPRDPVLELPGLYSPLLGDGLPWLATSDDPNIFQNLSESGQRLNTTRVEEIVKEMDDDNVPTDPTPPAWVAYYARRIASRHSGEYLFLDAGTVVPLSGEGDHNVNPTALVESYPMYPFHRLRDHNDGFVLVAQSYKAIARIQHEETRALVFAAIKRFLTFGYPVPGFSGDRWTFLMGSDPNYGGPQGHVAVTVPRYRWTMDDLLETGRVHSTRRGTVPIVTVGGIDGFLLGRPLAVTCLMLGGTPFDSSMVSSSHSAEGLEVLRKDYMVPVPIAILKKDGALEML
ncbi:hypothetical protein M427DRAFT_59074 [Gonapodya prolifera JEL478]|uniref:Uncharacterized protein n=1 Tax=Gonapodya prolifera (strain JEL478) TaxID=1344416 RepID=A0A139A837_GONPJ|nr:hypothetical protein M427DRAFT_59074 [Gonapodya prolifera JEL478]|eukprot:KXS12962.1 hypothetical protein M427DRAFT_59074 [Gonapodya prolifera JEL478]